MSEHYKYTTRKTKDLIPYENNSNKHSDEQVEQIANSIEKFKFTNPILIDENNGIIAGHGRVLGANKLNIEELPCIILEGLTEAEKKAYVIADNQIANNSEWDIETLKLEIESLEEMDFNIDIFGFDDDFLLGLELGLDESAGLTDEDAVPNPPKDPVSKRGDLWLLGEHRLMNGDSTSVDDVDKLLIEKKIDLIFSDPPYGVSYSDKNEFLNKYDNGNRNETEIINDHLTLDETGQLWADIFSLWSTKLADYHSYYIASPQGGDLLMMMMMMNDNNFPLRHTIIWNKNNHVLGRCDYMYKHEPILYGWNSRHKFYGKGEHTKSVWDIAKPIKNDLHPTMKPVELVVNAIRNSSTTGQIVADMFLGSGTTLIAADKTNRICYGMELSDVYCDVIIKRWQDFTGKEATLESTGETFNFLNEN